MHIRRKFVSQRELILNFSSLIHMKKKYRNEAKNLHTLNLMFVVFVNKKKSGR